MARVVRGSQVGRARSRPGVSAHGLSAALAALLLAFCGCAGDDSGSASKGDRSRGGASPTASGAASAGWTAVEPGAPPFNLVLLSLDTTRQDRLSCYGFAKKTTPRLDRLAEEGAKFANALTPVPVTLPSHATMLTGLYPFQHGVRHNGTYVLADSFPTLAELLHARGYATGAVLGAFPVDHRFGLAQGFGSYDDRFPPRTANEDAAQRPAAEVTRLACQWVGEHEGGPFFLWAHYYDPHAPYHPIEPFRSRFTGDAYAGEVAAMDDAIGALLDFLAERRLLERTIVIVAADHGEGLGDHQEPTHSTFIYGSTQSVPFIVRLPDAGAFRGKSWRGREVEDLACLTDILPTAWNALGFARAELPRVAGKSLLPAIAGSGSGHEWIYHETLVPDLDFGLSELRGLQSASWKYIRAPQPEIYQLERDPGELENLADRETERLQSMERQLQEVLIEDRSAFTPSALDEVALEKLRSLGYLQGERSAAKPRVDPKELTGVGRATARAQALADAHRTEQALQVLDSLLVSRPETRLALRLRANYLLRLERGAEALEAYERALADCAGCPDEFRLLQEQASAYAAAGRPDEALQRTRLLIAARPEEQGLHLQLGEILEQQGDRDAAIAAWREEARLFPREALPLVKIGMAESARTRMREAEAAYRSALAVAPRDADALVALSQFLSDTGRAAEAGPLVDQALAADPGHPGAHYRKAWLLRSSADRGRALDHYAILLRAEPENAKLLFEVGTLYAEMRRNDEARRSYEAAVRTGNAPAGAYANLGQLAGEAGRLEEAMRWWRQALERRPDEQQAAIIRANLAKAEEMMRAGRGARR